MIRCLSLSATALTFLLAGCGRIGTPTSEAPAPALAESEPPATEETAPPAPAITSTTYRCGKQTVAAEARGDTLRLEIGGDAFTLRQAVSASGARYEAAGDPSTYFWTKGDNALLSLHGVAYPECAVLTGSEETPTQKKTFSARGNEPGWSLNVTDDTIVLLADYGERRVAAPKPQGEKHDGVTRYSIPAEELSIVIEDALCADDATGMPHPNRVTVHLGERTFTGCGGEPSALLIGPEWVVEDINNGGIIDASRATLNFAEDGRVFGRASCNTYNAQYALTREGLTFGMAATTRMACAPALMQQEQRFLDALAGAVRFEIDETGALILHTTDGRRILARRG